MRRLFALLVVCIFAFPATVWSASPQEPAYRVLKAQANYPWNHGLSITIEQDETQCRAKYGKAWQVKCAAALGKPGTTVKGVKLNPPAKGFWQWVDSMSMEFVPENGESIRPDTKYTVDLSGVFRPSFVIINKNTATFRTLPISVRLVNLSFWTDPSPAARHRLAGSFEFNYPVPENAAEIEALPPQGAIFGIPEMVWNQDRDRLNISWPVHKLPAKAGMTRIKFQNMGQIALQDGETRYWPAQKGQGVIFESNLPAGDGLFTIKSMALAPALDDNLDRCYELNLETSLYIAPRSLLEHLHIYELPQFNSPEAREPYNWKLSPGLSEKDLQKSVRLNPVLVDGEQAERTKFRFRIQPAPGRYIIAFVKDDLLSASKQKLSRPVLEIMRAEPTGPALDFLQTGNILSLNDKGALDIYSTDLDSIVWEAQLVREPFLALLAESSPTPFQNPLSRMNMGMEAFSTSKKGNIPVPKAPQGEARFSSIELGPVIDELAQKDGRGALSGGLVSINLTGMKDGREKAWATRLILATNLGIIVKRGAMGEIDCFAHTLEGSPAANAKISILGANGKPVVSASANERGHVAFPSLNGLKREMEPVAAVAEKDGNLAWLPLKDRSRELNYSEFPVAGAHSTPDGFNAFVFSQRGIYRPGDTLYFGCVPRRADMSLLPADMPLYAELLDPRGTKIHEVIFKAGEFGIAEFSWLLPYTALSGRYVLNVLTGKNGENLASTTVRVEEFQPDTLKLKIDAPHPAGWLCLNSKTAASQTIGFVLQNLYGTPAEGHTIRAQLETQPARFNFPQFAEYTFMDPAPLKGQGLKIKLPDLKTGTSGEASLNLLPAVHVATSAKIVISGEGFDLSGGRATVMHTSILASPMDKMLGYKPMQSLTNLQFIPLNQKAALEFLAIDPNLQKTAWPAITFTISHRAYVTSLISDGQGGFRYDETPADLPVRSWTADIPVTGMELDLDTSTAGEFLLTARDDKGHIIARVPYAVAGERLDPPNAPLAGGKMRVRLDRENYAAGDEINLALAVPYDGTGLISIEREGVAAFEWFEAKAGESTHKIKIPADFEGKGYIVVSFSRSPKSSAIYMAPHTYALVPFSANIKKRDMDLRITAPGQVLPGKRLPVQISAKERGMALVFAVDEGVLQLTNYSSPMPLNTLLADRALDVCTLQAMDLVMPEHDILSRRLSAFGGGMDGGSIGARFQNPFRRKNEPPLTSWSSLVPVGPEPVEISIPVPDYYNGKMRIMAVGAGENSVGGIAEEAVSIAPLVLTPAMPLTVSPGDEFEGDIIVANTSDRDMELELNVNAGKHFAIQKEIDNKFNVEAGSEILVPICLKALDEPGAAEIKFNVETGNGIYTRSSYLSVRPNSALRTSLQAGITKVSGEIPINRDVYPQNAKSVATLSSFPIPLAAGFAQYLQTYPYGCSEQLISRAFGQTLLRAWPVVSGDIHARQKLLEATLAALRARYNGNGISLWPGGEADPLLTVYAVDFLLTLREAGISGGDDLLALLCDTVESNCGLNDSTLSAARVCAYGIWTLTRSGRVTTQLIESLMRAISERNISGWQNDLTAALIAASQREMHMSRTISFEITNYQPDGWFDEFAQYAMYVTVLARYFPEKCDEKTRDGFYEATAMSMLKNDFATFSANQGIRALLSLSADSVPQVLQASLHCDQNEEAGETTLVANGAMLNYQVEECKKYILDVPQGSPNLFWQISVTGYDRDGVEEHAARGIEISRRYLNEDGHEINQASQGEKITVEITARALTDNISDCVITDLLPGGFEMVLTGGEYSNKDLPAGIKFIDRREDRMLIFGNLDNDPKTFTYSIRAGSRGKFKTAPVYAQAMYQNGIYGHGIAGTLEVSRQAH